MLGLGETGLQHAVYCVYVYIDSKALLQSENQLPKFNIF